MIGDREYTVWILVVVPTVMESESHSYREAVWGTHALDSSRVLLYPSCHTAEGVHVWI